MGNYVISLEVWRLRETATPEKWLTVINLNKNHELQIVLVDIYLFFLIYKDSRLGKPMPIQVVLIMVPMMCLDPVFTTVQL